MNHSLIKHICCILIFCVTINVYAQLEKTQVLKDVVYKTGKHQDLKLDIYRLDSNSKMNPVVIYIHGGAWTFGDKSSILKGYQSHLLNQLLQDGFTVVSINYSFINDVEMHFPTPIEDCKDAIRWVKKNAEVYNLNVDDIGAWGNSAGAHLAMIATMMSDEMYITTDDLKPYTSKVNYIIDFYGAVNLNTAFRTDRSNTSLFFLKLFKKDIYSIRQSLLHNATGLNLKTEMDSITKAMSLYSPISYVNRSSVPMLIVQGNKDKVVLESQSIELKKSLDGVGVYSKLLILEGEDHGFKDLTQEHKNILIKEFSQFIQDRNKIRRKQ